MAPGTYKYIPGTEGAKGVTHYIGWVRCTSRFCQLFTMHGAAAETQSAGWDSVAEGTSHYTGRCCSKHLLPEVSHSAAHHTCGMGKCRAGKALICLVLV